MSWFFILLISLLTTLLALLRHVFNYWEQLGVPQYEISPIWGSLGQIKSFSLRELLQTNYDQFKGKAKIAGSYIYTKPIAIVLDLDLVKSVLIKDFSNFVDRTEYKNSSDVLSGNLFHLNADKWRPMRTKLTPTFTSGKMKYMFPTIVNVAHEFKAAFSREVEAAPDGKIELHDIIARYTTDIIGNCAFGIESNSLKNPNFEFRQMGRRYFIEDKKRSMLWQHFKECYSNLLKHIGMKIGRSWVAEFFTRVVHDTVELRERENIKRNDFINLLIELKNSKDSEGLTLDEITAQVWVFFIAGFETSSSNMSYTLFELAINPHVQEKLRSEILAVLERHDGVLSYEAMMEMTYLDQVISETLRKYPALAGLTRIAMQDYQVPDTKIVLKKGTRLYIPIRAIHYDPDIYENPQEYRPERFAPEEVQKRHPQSFLGFGDGPRNCIGLRFGRMQSRIGLITLLSAFKFKLPEGSSRELAITKASFILVPESGVWIQAEKL